MRDRLIRAGFQSAHSQSFDSGPIDQSAPNAVRPVARPEHRSRTSRRHRRLRGALGPAAAESVGKSPPPAFDIPRAGNQSKTQSATRAALSRENPRAGRPRYSRSPPGADLRSSNQSGRLRRRRKPDTRDGDFGVPARSGGEGDRTPFHPDPESKKRPTEPSARLSSGLIGRH